MSPRKTIAALCAPILIAIALAVTVGSASSAPTAETREGTFIVNCPFSHFAQVDPIVAPGQVSAHMHTFTANRSTNANSTYASMQAGATTCKHPGDKAGYWTPSLIRPDGSLVVPERSFAYYKNLPVGLPTETFPPDFRMVWGPSGFFWDCFNGGGNYTTSIPRCTNDFLVVRGKSPPCWDGRLDSPDHRSHVANAVGKNCPASHPRKLPMINFFTRYPKNEGGPGYYLSDKGQNGANGILPHADFWNTWIQSELEEEVRDCLRAGVNCGQVTN